MESVNSRHFEDAHRIIDQRCHAIFDAIDQGFCIVEVSFEKDRPAAYHLLDSNKAFKSQHGLRGAEGTLMQELAPADDPRWEDVLARVALSGESERFVNQTRHSDGRWYDIHAFRTGPPEEHKVAILFKDITRRKHTELALERRLIALTQTMDDGAPIGIEDLFNIAELQNIQDQFAQAFHVASVITLPDGTPVTQPSNFTRLCAEVIRQTEKGRANCYKSDALLGRYHPDGPVVSPCLSCGLLDAGASISVGGRHAASWLIGQVRDGLQTEPAMRAYARDIGADEEEFIEAFRKVPAMRREDFNRIANLLFTLANKLSDMAYQNIQQARFITERKQAEEAVRRSEQRYRSLFQSMEAFALMEPVYDEAGKAVDFRYLEVNEAGARIRGVTAADEILGKTILEVLPTIDPFWIESYGQVLKSGEPLQFERRHQDNQRWFRTYAYCPEQGKVASLIIDVTSRKLAEEELQELTRTLEQKVAERTEMAETRAKQLQALAVELIEAEEQERRRLAELLHEDLQQILASARFQMQAAVENSPSNEVFGNVERLLEEAITKSRNLSHELSPPILNQSSFVKALQWLISRKKEMFGLDVSLEAIQDPHVDLPIKTFLFRAVQELLFNVVKHAAVKKARVVITRSENTIALIVSDRGRGFDPDMLASDVVKGGLGLRSLRERARHIGGSLTVESIPEGGSRFVLTVPATMEETIAPVRLPPVVEDRQNMAAQAVAISGKPGIRVLFVDDHKVMRQGLMKLVAGKSNIEVVGEASNGQEALELTRRIRPDVVIMDVAMPVMDGIEATRRIKSELPDVRVIGLSMFEDEHTAEAMRNAGAELFISKAASSSALLESIYSLENNPPNPQTGPNPSTGNA